MIVVVGEALVDVVVSPDGEREEKVGGSPMNVAVGLGRLDVPALLLTQVGADERGRAITDHVASSGAEVETSPTDDGRTSTATAHLDASGSATYDFDLTWSLPRRELPPCDALHVGSLGAALAPGRDAVLDLVSQAWDRDVFVSFDPNVRPAFLTDRGSPGRSGKRSRSAARTTWAAGGSVTKNSSRPTPNTRAIRISVGSVGVTSLRSSLDKRAGDSFVCRPRSARLIFLRRRSRRTLAPTR